MRLHPIAPLTALALSLASCSDSSTAPADAPSTAMSATAGDRGLVMTRVTFDRVDTKYFVSGSTADQAPFENIIISLDSLTGPGTFTIPKPREQATVVTARYRKVTSETSGTEEYDAVSGTVVIESIDETQAQGTFFFDAKRVGSSERILIGEGMFRTKKR